MAANTARVLLNAIFHSPDQELPEEYIRQARLLTSAVLSLSHAVCSRAGLRRGITTTQARRGEPFVPGAARLAELRSAVTLTPGDLSNLLPDTEMQALREWITEAGAHRVNLDGSVTDNGLILRPLVRHGTSLIIANPGELAAALRHHLIVMADIHGCRDTLAGAFRRTVAELTRELLSQVDAISRGRAAPTTDPLVLRQVFDAASGTIIDVGVLTDDLSGYDPADPFGHWDIPNAGQPLQDCLDPPGPPGEDDERTLRLAVYDDLARTQTVALERYRRPGPLLTVPLDELQVMIDLDTDDPLFLWRFARANERLHESSRVLSWSVLDTYSIYRDHDHSFYLDDDRPPNVVSVSVASGASLRADAQRRHDRHYVPDPNGRKYVEVASVYGSDTAPIYYRHPRHGPAALLVEFAGATAWVLHNTETSEAVSGFLFTLLEAVAYWIWQLSLEQPSMLAGAAGPGGRLRVLVEPDDSSRWYQVLTGQSPDDPDGPEDGRGSASVSWVTASADSPGAITVTVLAEHAQVLLSGTNLADRQLVAALARALAPGDPPEQIDAAAAKVAPPGPKRMIHVWRSGDVMLVPAGVSMRAVQPAVTATILDDLGQWLAGQGLGTGPLPSDERTKILGQVVEYYLPADREGHRGAVPGGAHPLPGSARRSSDTGQRHAGPAAPVTAGMLWSGQRPRAQPAGRREAKR